MIRRARSITRTTIALAIVVVAASLTAIAPAAADTTGPGSPDPTFGSSGKVTTTPFGAGAAVEVLDIEPGAAAGVFILSARGNKVAVTALDAVGDPVAGFGTNGNVVIPTGAATQGTGGLVRAPNGSLYGAATVAGDVFLFHLKTNGTLDPAFDGDGTKLVSLGGNGQVDDATISSSGTIVLAVSDDGAGKLLRFDSTGVAGTTTVVDDSGAAGLRTGLTLGDGRIVTGGTTSSGGGRGFVARVTSGGTLDPTFGTAGFAYIDLGSEIEVVADVSLLGDGSIVAVGRTSTPAAAGVPNGSVDAFVAKLNPAGLPDTSFGDNGIVRRDLGGAETGDALSVLTTSESAGDLIISGLSKRSDGTYSYTTRMSPNGLLRRQYGDNGTALTGPLTEPIGRQADGATQPNDKTFTVVANGPSITTSRYRAGAASTLEPDTSALVPVVPARLLDTRKGIGAPVGRPISGQVLSLQVTGRGGVPATGVAGVVMNVTATSSLGQGYVTVYPNGKPRPGTQGTRATSNLNIEYSGQTIPNNVIVPTGAGGRVNLFTSIDAHLVADVTGYFLATSDAVRAGRYVPVTPTRLLDSRGPNRDRPVLEGGVNHTLKLTGTKSPVPAGASAVVLNVTATEPVGQGYVTVFPKGAGRPVASNLNIEFAGQTRPNSVIVKVGDDESIHLFASTHTHLVVDVAGYFTADTAAASTAGLFVPLTPDRILDTRVPIGAPSAARVEGGKKLTLQITGRGGVAPIDVAGAVMNTTVTQTSSEGYATVFPTGITRPVVSNLNFTRAGQTIPNLVLTPLSAEGGADLYITSRSHLVADVTGYFLG